MEIDDFIDECLLEHNNKRKLHGAEPLKHCRALDNTAQEWANYLVLKENLQNSPLSNRGEIGESISMRSSTGPNVDIKGFEVTSQWYGDIKNYDFQTGKGPAGNFTQLVWANSKEVGFGKAKIGNKCIIVAHYRPAGNIRGRYLENVFSAESSSYERNYNQETKGIESDLLKDINKDVDELKKGTYSRNESISLDNNNDGLESDDDLDYSISDKDNLRTFVGQMIKGHNVFRKRHCSQKLKHSRKLSELAQQWAEKLIKESVLSNSGFVYNGWRLGENIISRWSNNVTELPAQEILDQWYAENAKFKFNTEPESIQGIGNFTQMIWKTSRVIGIGRAVQYSGISGSLKNELSDKQSDYLKGSYSSRTIVVCFYYPPGNVASTFIENISPPETHTIESNFRGDQDKKAY